MVGALTNTKCINSHPPAPNDTVYVCFQIVSSTFYNNKLLSAEVLNFTRKSPRPCAWVHVGGGEEKHKDRVIIQTEHIL